MNGGGSMGKKRIIIGIGLVVAKFHYWPWPAFFRNIYEKVAWEEERR